LVWILNIMI